jgi:HNH endonuclease/AP2 domain
MITHEELVRLVHYDHLSGVFRSLLPGVKYGRILGGLNEKGHRRIRLNGKKYYAHRLAWLYVYSEWPPAIVDHINGNPDDNRIANLRAAEPWQNASNAKPRVSMWGLSGLHQLPHGKWQAQIGHQGRNIALGTFDTKEKAHAAYIEARRRLKGEFAERSGLGDPIPDPSQMPPASKIPELTQERLRYLLNYDPETGLFSHTMDRKKGPWIQKKAGDIIRDGMVRGYQTIFVDNQRYMAHRLAWLWVYGELPTQWIDHINGIRSDNRIANLRLAGGQSNAANSKGWKKTGTGLKGCYRNKKSSINPWYAAIRVNRKLIHLGSYPTEQAAHEAYLAAAKVHFGEFANAGSVARASHLSAQAPIREKPATRLPKEYPNGCIFSSD